MRRIVPENSKTKVPEIESTVARRRKLERANRGGTPFFFTGPERDSIVNTAPEPDGIRAFGTQGNCPPGLLKVKTATFRRVELRNQIRSSLGNQFEDVLVGNDFWRP